MVGCSNVVASNATWIPKPEATTKHLDVTIYHPNYGPILWTSSPEFLVHSPLKTHGLRLGPKDHMMCVLGCFEPLGHQVTALYRRLVCRWVSLPYSCHTTRVRDKTTSRGLMGGVRKLRTSKLPKLPKHKWLLVYIYTRIHVHVHVYIYHYTYRDIAV